MPPTQFGPGAWGLRLVNGSDPFTKPRATSPTPSLESSIEHQMELRHSL